MSKVKYADAPAGIAEAIEASRPIVDFLPSPDELARNVEKEKITINVDTQALTRFRAYAKDHGIKYQVLMNQVLTSYAKEWL